MPRPLSDSWQYFELLERAQGKSRKARCKFCGHEQAAGITRLHQHLLQRCSMISSDIRNQLRQRQEDRERDSISPETNDLASQNPPQQNPDSANYNFESSLQNTLHSKNTNTQHSSPLNNTCINTQSTFYALSPSDSTNFATANPLTFQPSSNTSSNILGEQQQQQQQQQERSQAMLDYHLARALFSANIPFQKIENPYMVDFLKRLQPNYVVPNAKKLQQVLLKEQHWDLIHWDTGPNSSPPLPPPPHINNNTVAILQQQQQRRMMLSSSTTSNNTANGTSHIIGNRLMNSHHPPADLEGSL